ncbi:hypothetical protein SK128_000516, partial [Halocaridina rubra]
MFNNNLESESLNTLPNWKGERQEQRKRNWTACLKGTVQTKNITVTFCKLQCCLRTKS